MKWKRKMNRKNEKKPGSVLRKDEELFGLRGVINDKTMEATPLVQLIFANAVDEAEVFTFPAILFLSHCQWVAAARHLPESGPFRPARLSSHRSECKRQ